MLGGSEFHFCVWVEAVYKMFVFVSTDCHVYLSMGCLANWMSSAKQQLFVVRMLGRSITWVRSRVIFALWYMCLFGDI